MGDIHLRFGAVVNGRVRKVKVDVCKAGQDDALFKHTTAVDRIEDRKKACREIAGRLREGHRIGVDTKDLLNEFERGLMAALKADEERQTRAAAAPAARRRRGTARRRPGRPAPAARPRRRPRLRRLLAVRQDHGEPGA
jgi:hypothetical protein